MKEKNRKNWRISVLLAGMAIALTWVWAPGLQALQYPHNPGYVSNPVSCDKCHSSAPAFKSLTSLDVMCINASGCHNSSGKAGKKRLTTKSASNRFNSLPPDPTAKQSSHGWDIPNTTPDAGATNNWYPAKEYNGWTPLKGRISCTRCHRAHGDMMNVPIYRSFLKGDPKGDDICFQCHAARRVNNVRDALASSSLHYSHPVEVNYSSARAKPGKSSLYFRNPTSSYPANPSAKLKLYTTKAGVKGTVVCSTCHGPIHSADSNPYTFDNLTTYASGNYSTSAGNLLRRYDKKKDITYGINDLCQSCHKVSTHRGYNCYRCHTPHKKAGENNRYLILQNISTPNTYKRNVVFTSFSEMADRWTNQGEPDGKSNAICQVCHTTTRFHRNYSTGGTVKREGHVSPNEYFAGTGKYKYCPECHEHGSGFSPSGEAACGACHKLPPSDTYGKHSKHVGTGANVGSYKWDTGEFVDDRTAASYGFSCGRCHSKWAPYTSSQNYPRHRPADNFNDSSFGRYTAEVGFKSINSQPLPRNSDANAKYTYGARGGLEFGNASSASNEGSWFSWPASGSGTCDNLYCHGQFFNGYTANDPVFNGAGATQRCGKCHGVAQELGQGLPGKTGSNNWGAHPRHVGAGSQQYGQGAPRFRCNACHAFTATQNTISSIGLDRIYHVNGRTNVKFDAAYNDAASTYGGMNTYTGETNRNIAWANRTPYKTCSLIYCHSDGSRLLSNYSASNHNRVIKFPNWSSIKNFTTIASNTRRCHRCHGADRTPGVAFTGITAAMPGYDTRADKGNSHRKHVVDNGFMCRVCHSRTVDTNNISIYWNISTRHVNKKYDVDIVSSYGGTYDSATKKCSNVECHGNRPTPAWGNPANCQDCHMSNTSDTDKRIVARSKFTGYTSSTPKIYSTQWTERGHGRSSGNYDKSGNVYANQACGACHRASVSHGTGSNPFRLITAPDRPNVVCNKCHGVGATGANKKNILTHASSVTQAGHNYEIKCIDCHDPHGDNNIFMLHSTLPRPGSMARDVASGKYGIITTTGGAISNVDFVNNVYTSDYAKKVTAPGVCQVCHDETKNPDNSNSRFQYNGTVDTPHGSGRCVDCHQHTSGFKGAGCNGCHGNPPTGTFNLLSGSGRTNNIKKRASGNSTVFGPHSTHVSVFKATGMSATQACAACHFSGMWGSGSENTNIDLEFRAFTVYSGTNQEFNSGLLTKGGFYGLSGIGVGTGSTNNRCVSMKCHGGGNWLTASYGTPTAPMWENSSNTARCGKCHGAKKAAGSGSWPTSPATSNAHVKHAGTNTSPMQYDFMCKLCHNATVLTSATTLDKGTHVNAEANFEFNSAGDNRVDAGAYNGDNTVNSGFGTCEGTYCHSRGTDTTAPYDGAALPNYTANWNDTASGKTGEKPCSYCHGNKTYGGITAAMPTQSGQAHAKHARNTNGDNFRCNVCHANVVDASGNIISRANHVNKFKNISVIKTYKTANEGYLDATKKCSSIKCHGERTTPAWTSTATCTDCHYKSSGAANEEDSFTWQNYSGVLTTSVADIYSTEWMKRGHGKTKASGKYPFSNNTGAGKTCNICHTASVKHNQANYFRLRTTVTSGDSDKLCAACHGSGTDLGKMGAGTFGKITGIQSHTWANISTGGYNGGANGKADWNFQNQGAKCVDCHDPHGDTSNNAMIHTYINMTGSDSAGRPNPVSATAQVTYTAVGGSQINWSSYARSDKNGICQRCHSTTVDFFNKTIYGNPAGSHNNGQRCTNCHKHKKGFAPAGCTSCHGDDTRPYDRSKMGPPKGPTTPLWSDSMTNKSSLHRPHAFNPNGRPGFVNRTGFGCRYCHGDTAADNIAAPGHNTGKTGANMNNLTSSDGFGGRNNQSKFSYGTNNRAPADDTCWNTTCHTPRYYTRGWKKPGDCDDCHGYVRTTGANRAFQLQTTGSHKTHINWTGTASPPASWKKNYRFACSRCHYDPANNYSTHYSGMVNFTAQGSPNNGGTYSRGKSFKGFTTGSELNNTSCAKVYCHGNFTNGTTATTPSWKKGQSAVKCGSCHKAKTAQFATWQNGTTMPARHPKHVRTATYNFGCSKCHVRTATNNTTAQFNWSSHANTTVDVYFDNVSGVFNSGNKTCQTSYCHSRGNSQAAPYVTANYTAKWTDSNKGCNYCHGDRTQSFGGITAAMPNNNAHVKHARNATGDNFRCSFCHANVVNNSGQIISYTNHVNKFKNISVITTYKTANEGYNPSGAKTCASIKCHNGRTTPAWTSTATCSSCHYKSSGAPNAEDSFTWQSYTGTVANIYSTEWSRKGHGQSTINRTCSKCHDSSKKHNLGSNPFRLYTSDSDKMCAACHGSGTELGKWGVGTLGNKTGIVTHSQAETGGDAEWNFPITNPTEMRVKCVDCHDPHGDRNRSMIHSFINFTGSDTYGKPDPINANHPGQMIFTTVGTQMRWSSFVNNSGKDGLCQRCHSSTVNNFDKAEYTPHNAGQNKRCPECHLHKSGFKGGGESTGGSNCAGCHTLYNKMRAYSTFHHVMQSDSATTPYSNITVYDQTKFTDTNRRCLMCHVDHDIFSPANNPTNGRRAKNLRVTASNTVTPSAADPNTFTATDFWPAKRLGKYAATSPVSISNGNGVCISCHKNVQMKNTTLQREDGTKRAMTFKVGLYTSSSHNFQIISGMNNFLDGSSFRANCTKCHNSRFFDQASKQTGKKFGLHDAKYPSMMNYSSLAAAGKPRIEDLCYKCHDEASRADDGPGATYDYYSSVQMNSGAKMIKTAIVAKKSGHPIESEAMAGLHKVDEYDNAASGWNSGSNRHVECVDCHNTHGGNATITRRVGGPFRGRVLPDATYSNYSGGNKVAGSQQGAWGVSLSYGGGAGTSPTFTKIDQVRFQYELCIKCHSSYGYGASIPGVPSGLPDPSGHSEVPYDNLDPTVPQSDIAKMINPNNYGFHPIFQKGRNQPGKSLNSANWPATKSNWMFFDKMTNRTGFISVSGLSWNFVPPYSQYSLLSCSDCHQADNTGKAIKPLKPTGAITQTGTWTGATNANIVKSEDGLFAQFVSTGTAGALQTDVTLGGSAPGPGPEELWVVAYGSTTLTGKTTKTQQLAAYNGLPGTIIGSAVSVSFATTIARAEAKITWTPTDWTTIENNYSAKITTNAAAGTVKVDYLGIEVVYTAASDVRGPHGSLEKWITTDVDTNIRFDTNYDNDMADAGDKPNSGFTGNALKIFCWNCHRSDVYYNSSIGGGPSVLYKNYARMDHTSGTVAEPFDDPFTSTNVKNVWGIACFNCHGGGGVGEIHGSFANSTTAQWWYPSGNAASRIKLSRPRGVRLLNGAAFALDPATGTCYTPANLEANLSAPAPYASGCSAAQHDTGGVTTTFNYTYTAW